MSDDVAYIHQQGELQEKQRALVGEGGSADVLPPPGQPLRVAREFAGQCFTHDDGLLTLRRWHGDWWRWRTVNWTTASDEEMCDRLYRFTEHAVYYTGPEKKEAWNPTRKKLNDALHALAGVCLLDGKTEQPSWLGGSGNGGTLVSMTNGILHVEERILLRHSPSFFNTIAISFAHDADAPEPARWLKFLGGLWPDEPAVIDALQEWFGYMLSGRTDLQKIALLVGPTRSGKGVIAAILTALIGEDNVAGPTLNSLAETFGLAPLHGKPLAIIPDARFAGRDGSIVVERLLSISGEDRVSVNRKNKGQVNIKLPSRITMLSNELPKLSDASSALADRLIILRMKRSWLGQENHNLKAELAAELPGILNWSLAGLARLNANGGRFTRVQSGDEDTAQIRDLASSVGAFARECCVLGPLFKVESARLYSAYRDWAKDNGYAPKSRELFGRDLRAACPEVRKVRPGDEKRVYEYQGITLA